MIIPSGANAGTYLVNWNGHGDALNLLRVKNDGSPELANSFSYSTWGTPTVDGTHDNSANANADYGDLGFRYLYVGQLDVQWDDTFGLVCTTCTPATTLRCWGGSYSRIRSEPR